MKNLFYLIMATNIGALCGFYNSICVVSGLAMVILSPVFNIYYAILFFLCGSYYTYKILKKNQI